MNLVLNYFIKMIFGDINLQTLHVVLSIIFKLLKRMELDDTFVLYQCLNETLVQEPGTNLESG